MTQSTKPFHIVAGVSTLLTLTLITLGGFVHNTGSSLACPDWPLCFGQVLPKMEGIVAIEHSHRLLASLVGFLNIVLLVLASRTRRAHPRIFKLSIISLLTVILQGVLGGITVLLKISPLVSTFHLALSQIYFAMLIGLFVSSRPGGYPALERAPRPSPKFLKILGAVTGLLFLQILVGAAIRHTGAGGACGLGPQYSVLCMEAETGGLTWWPTQIPSQFHIMHRYFGVLMVFIIVGGTVPLMKWARLNGVNVVRRWAVATHIFVLLQVLLGIMTVYTYIGVHGTTAHLFMAALLWAAFVVLNILVRRPQRTAP